MPSPVASRFRHSFLGLSLCVLPLLIFSACSSPPVKKEVHGEAFEVGQVAQSDSNRTANLAMRDNLESLSLLLEKLYKRNPAQWKKTGAQTLEEAHDRIMTAIRSDQPLPELGDAKSVAALPLAFDPKFQGDRAGTLIYALGTMLVEVYGGRTELYLVHGLNAQELSNAAYNVEVAVWLLSSRKDTQGNPLLLSNEIGPAGRNLSFEREFGRIIGRLELLAAISDEKYRRSAIGYVQGFFGATFMQFLPLDTVTAATTAH